VVKHLSNDLPPPTPTHSSFTENVTGSSPVSTNPSKVLLPPSLPPSLCSLPLFPPSLPLLLQCCLPACLFLLSLALTLSYNLFCTCNRHLRLPTPFLHSFYSDPTCLSAVLSFPHIARCIPVHCVSCQPCHCDESLVFRPPLSLPLARAPFRTLRARRGGLHPYKLCR
jgi:hypothetical protein